jgi:hypothetical protein
MNHRNTSGSGYLQVLLLRHIGDHLDQDIKEDIGAAVLLSALWNPGVKPMISATSARKSGIGCRSVL